MDRRFVRVSKPCFRHCSVMRVRSPRAISTCRHLVQDTLVLAYARNAWFLGGARQELALIPILTNLNRTVRDRLARRPQFLPLLETTPTPRPSQSRTSLARLHACRRSSGPVLCSGCWRD